MKNNKEIKEFFPRKVKKIPNQLAIRKLKTIIIISKAIISKLLSSINIFSFLGIFNNLIQFL